MVIRIGLSWPSQSVATDDHVYQPIEFAAVVIRVCFAVRLFA
jgi:hypothetical protein